MSHSPRYLAKHVGVNLSDDLDYLSAFEVLTDPALHPYIKKLLADLDTTVREFEKISALVTWPYDVQELEYYALQVVLSVARNEVRSKHPAHIQTLLNVLIDVFSTSIESLPYEERRWRMVECQSAVQDITLVLRQSYDEMAAEDEGYDDYCDDAD